MDVGGSNVTRHRAMSEQEITFNFLFGDNKSQSSGPECFVTHKIFNIFDFITFQSKQS